MQSQLRQKIIVVKAVIHCICILLLVNEYWLALNDGLGADPVEAVLHFTGIGALNLLIISLSITPVIRLFKFTSLINYRRMLGVYSFVYALMHLLSFLAFEVQFDWRLFITEIIERPYMTLGMAAIVILLSLTLTSTARVKRKMGKSWQKLHNWVYLAIILASVHFYMSVKSDVVQPIIYAAIVAILLWFRRKKFQKHL